MTSDNSIDRDLVPSAQISRRQFVKLGMKVAETVAASSLVGGVLKTAETIDKIRTHEEGNDFQRTQVFLCLARRIIAEPSEENRNLLSSWLVLNGAEIYAREKGYFQTEGVIRHFLYGKGEALDITETYLRAVYRDGKEEGLPVEKILSKHFENIINFETRHMGYIKRSEAQGYRITEPSGEILESLSKGEQVPEGTRVSMTIIVDSEQLPERDLYYSLHRYSIYVSGIVDGDARIAGGEIPQVVLPLKNVDCEISDRYDWHSLAIREGFSTGQGIDKLLRTIGVQSPYGFLTRTLGEKKAHQIMFSGIYFVDKDGVALEREGFGTPFDIFGRFKLSKAEFIIDRTFVEKGIPVLHELS